MKFEKKLIAFAVFVLMLTFVSASFGDWVKGITGRASFGETNATVTITGSNNVTVIIWNYTLTGSVVNPTEDGVKFLVFNLTVSDADGAADINTSSISMNVTKTSGLTKANSSCTEVGTATATSKNYTCGFQMWYFEEAGQWTITASANDYGTQNYKQNTSTFQWGSLTAMVISPVSLTWPGLSPGQTNQTASNDPTLINNTGNYNVTNLTITGINLVGADPSYYIGAGNITVDVATGGSCSGGACVECGVSAATGGVTMANATALEIYGAGLARGNHSVGDGTTGQEQLYYCMVNVPSNILSQTYSTAGGNEWTITISA